MTTTHRRLIDEIKSTEDFLATPPARNLGGPIQDGSLVVVYGTPGAGKSFLSLDFGLSVSAGRAWRDKAIEASPVLYVVAEDAVGTASRVRSWRARHGWPDNDNIAWLPRAVPLLAAGTIDQLTEVARTRAIRLIMIDTLARCTPGVNENSTQEWGLVVEAANRLIADTGACVVFVHHSGKDLAKGMRGSNVLLAAADTTLECQRTRTGMTVMVRKQKNGADGQVMRFRLEPEGDSAVLIDDGEGTAAASSGWRPTVLMARVSEFLAAQTEPVSKALIEKQVQGKTDAVRVAITRLIEEGYAVAENGPRGAVRIQLLRQFEDAE